MSVSNLLSVQHEVHQTLMQKTYEAEVHYLKYRFSKPTPTETALWKKRFHLVLSDFPHAGLLALGKVVGCQGITCKNISHLMLQEMLRRVAEDNMLITDAAFNPFFKLLKIAAKAKVISVVGVQASLDLVLNNKAFDVATFVAGQVVNDKANEARGLAYALLYKLVEKGHAFDECLKAAKDAFDSGESQRSLILYKKLVMQGKAFNEAKSAADEVFDANLANLNIAKQNPLSNDPTPAEYEAVEALELYVELAKKGHVFEKASIAAELASFSHTLYVRTAGLDALLTLKSI